MAKCSIPKKTTPKHRWNCIISTQAAIPQLMLEVKTCESAQRQKVSKDSNTLAVNLTGPLLSAISQTQQNILFSLSPFPDHISPVKTESFVCFFLSYESSLHPCGTTSNYKLKSQPKKMSPVQPYMQS